MSFPKLDACCCGCSLRLGTSIIGYISLFFAVFGLYCAVTDSGPSTYDIGNGQSVENPFASFGRIRTGWNIVSVLYAALILGGVYRQDRMMLLVWVILSMPLSILFLIVLIGLSFYFKVIWIMTLSVFPLFSLYLSWVVYSYAEEIRENGSSETIKGRATVA